MRIIGMDIHRVFAEAVVVEDGEIKRLGRIGMTRNHLEAFARTLLRRITSLWRRPAMRQQFRRSLFRMWREWPWRIRCRCI